MTFHDNNANLQEIKAYTPPQLYTGKTWFVGFNAWDPARKSMRRKKIHINYIDKITERRKYAANLIKRLISQLEKGWNPWIESESGKAYKTFQETVEHYDRQITHLFNQGNYSEDTYISYKSLLKNLVDYNNRLSLPIYYIYQFTRSYIIDFLEEIFIERKNTATTRDNYLYWLRTFSTFLVNFGYSKTKPTEGLSAFNKKLKQKKRTVINEFDLIRIREYLWSRDKHYLLACYIIHYCFLRPNEMRQLKLDHFSIKNKTIFISGEISKNNTSAVITLPDNVIKLMLDLDVFNCPGSYYLFSNDFMPGEEERNEKRFRDYWSVIRKELKLPASYKFYSFKDTGITSLLRTMDPLSVRDQARHSSLIETDRYTPHDVQKANQLIAKHQGIF